jgi:SnoaL-like domain
MPTAVERVVRRYMDSLNQLDVDGMMSTFASDAVVHFPGLDKTDVDSFRQLLNQLGDALSESHVEEKEIFLTEYGAAVRWGYDATTKAGRHAHGEGVNSWIVGSDGKATAFALYGDVTPLLAALEG